MANVLYKASIGSLGKEEETKTVDLSMVSGNQIIFPTIGKVLNQVTITKPGTLIDANIKEGINIGGIIGTYIGGGEQPTLNAPTISRSSDKLTITNPSTNGNFINEYKIYNGTTLLTTVSASGSTTYNLLQLGGGEYKLTVRACGNNFNDSIDSNSVEYVIYTITNVLDNITNSNTNTSIGIGQTYSGTLSVANGYYLPNNIIITQNELPTYFAYNNVTGVYSVLNVSGSIVINASGSLYSILESPSITLTNNIITWESINGATNYSIKVNGVEVATTSLLSIDLSTIFTENGSYDVTVVAQGDGYQESVPSNQVIYNIGVVTYGVTGLDLSPAVLTRTDNNEGKTYLINSSTGVITTDFDDVFVEQYVGDSLQQISYNSANNNWVDKNNTQYSGNVFRKFNKFYKKIILNENGERSGFKIAFANSCPEGFYCPAYFTNEDGSEMDCHLIGVYKSNYSNSKLRSISGTSINFATAFNFQTYGKNASNTYLNCFVTDWRSEQLIRDLFMIIFATRNTRSIWSNVREYSQRVTGKANSIRILSQNGLDPSTKTALFLGIEDIIGINNDYIAGVYFNNSSIYYSKTPSTDEASLVNKTLLGYSVSISGGVIKKMGYDPNNPDLEIPIETTTGSRIYYVNRHTISNGERILVSGGAQSNPESGLFYTSIYYTANSISVFDEQNPTSRLCAQPR